MAKTAIEEPLEKNSSKGIEEVFVGEKRFIADMNFETFFVFRNKKLVEIFLANDLSREYQRYERIDNKEFLFYKTREYINTFTTTFLYASSRAAYYERMPRYDMNAAIKSGFIFYWGVGKSTFAKARHNAPSGLPSLLNNIPKTKKIVQVSLADSLLVISFKRFRDVNKKGTFFRDAVELITRSTE